MIQKKKKNRSVLIQLMQFGRLTHSQAFLLIDNVTKCFHFACESLPQWELQHHIVGGGDYRERALDVSYFSRVLVEIKKKMQYDRRLAFKI